MMQYYLKPTKFTNGGKDVHAYYYGTCDYHIEYNNDNNNRPKLPIGWLPKRTYICGKPLTPPPYFISI
jgi:hypothetical protein